MKLYIKNMVCQRCISAVRSTVTSLGIPYTSVQLGEVETIQEPDAAQKEALRLALAQLGFELFDDKRSRLIEQIKTAIINLVHHSNDEKLKVNLSDYLSEITGRDYNTLSALFSEVEGLTIERYLILQRIERVKELLVYDELTLSEIAHQLGYSSVAHLSAQFKKNTGFTPSHFRRIREQKRKPLDEVR